MRSTPAHALRAWHIICGPALCGHLRAWRKDMQQSQFTVKSPEGQSHKVQGDPSVLTLRDVIGEVYRNWDWPVSRRSETDASARRK